jgi:esterase/lipase superfamily enzyme
MRRSHEMIDSQAMGRRVHLWRYGHWGAPLIVFPTAAGFAHEWEREGMLEVLAPLIYQGKLKLYCPESNVSETWTKKETDPRQRVRRHMDYERFILDDLVPAIRADCNSTDIKIATAGASLGAMFAANFALKFSEIFDYALCLSGRYDATNFTGGYSNDDIYYSNPMAFVSNLEGEALAKVQANTQLTLVCGQGRWEEGCIEETQQLADILAAKGIQHIRDIWGHDVSHDWIWWQRQTLLHFTKTFG